MRSNPTRVLGGGLKKYQTTFLNFDIVEGLSNCVAILTLIPGLCTSVFAIQQPHIHVSRDGHVCEAHQRLQRPQLCLPQHGMVCYFNAEVRLHSPWGLG
jgi:hypothetical protein